MCWPSVVLQKESENCLQPVVSFVCFVARKCFNIKENLSFNVKITTLPLINAQIIFRVQSKYMNTEYLQMCNTIFTHVIYAF